jgi:protein SCO1/2
MKTLAVLSSLILGIATTNADSLTEAQLLNIKFDQHLNAQVSPSLAFQDDGGKNIHLGDYFGDRPIVLILGYYGCPMLCTLTLNGATESFRDLKWSVGRNFDVVFVSIDPSEGTSLAAAKKENYVRVYNRPGAAAGWHFLVGGAAAVKTLADEVGFRYAYDDSIKQFAHPSGFVVLTPEGKISHYFFGVTFSANDVNAALRAASDRKISSPLEEFVLCCFHDAPTGKYARVVLDTVRAGGAATVLALGALLVLPKRRKPEQRK